MHSSGPQAHDASEQEQPRLGREPLIQPVPDANAGQDRAREAGSQPQEWGRLTQRSRPVPRALVRRFRTQIVGL